MHRLPQATYVVRESLLDYVLPWLYNMELMEPSLLATATNTDSLTVDSTDKDTAQPGLLKGRGWGSPEATDMILNNLLYATLTVSTPCITIIIIIIVIISFIPVLPISCGSHYVFKLSVSEKDGVCIFVIM